MPSLADLISEAIPEPGSVVDKARWFFARAGGNVSNDLANEAGPDLELESNFNQIHKFVMTGDVEVSLTEVRDTEGLATTVTIIAVQDGAGSHDLTFADTIVWPGGTLPDFDVGPNRASYIELTTVDGGTTWYGFLGGSGGSGGGGGEFDGDASDVPFTPAAGIAATDVQAAIVEDAGDLAAHLADAVAAHAGTAIANTPAGSIAATTVQAAINELDGDIGAHLADAADAHDASAISILDTANDFTATDVEGALAELQSDNEAHLADTSNAHAASAVGFTPAGSIVATDAQAAIVEVSGDVDAHIVDATAAHAATAIAVTPAGTISSTTVQAALEELSGDIGAGGIPATIADAAGDLIVASAADTVAKLAAGTDGYALVSNTAGSGVNKLAYKHPQAIPHEANIQTDSYGIVLSDVGKIIIMNKATACTLTVPAAGTIDLPDYTVIPVFQMGAGTVTIAITSDTLNRPPLAVTPVTMNGQGSWACLVKISNTVWQVFGDITTRVRTPVTLVVSDPGGDAITTGDGKLYYPIPAVIGGYDLVEVNMFLTTTSSSGIPTVQIANLTQAADMLTTKLTVDAGELTSRTAAAAAVIDTGNDDVATGDMIRIDIDVAGTGAKGLIVELVFQ